MNTNSRAAVGVSTSFPGRNTHRSLENALEISMEAQLMIGFGVVSPGREFAWELWLWGWVPLFDVP